MTTTTVDPVLDPLRRELLGSLLRYQVGRVIFCPGAACGGQVLDWRRAVGIGSHTVCTTCWGSLSAEQRNQVIDLAAETQPAPTELLDGPALSGGDPVIVRTVDPELEARRPGPGQLELAL